jgi:hypothetical protein
MRPLPKLICLPLLALALGSCGGEDSPAKTHQMTFEQFKTKLASLPRADHILCNHCGGTGEVVDPDDYRQTIECPECDGSGTLEGDFPPTWTDFVNAVGRPERQERKEGDFIWRYWYFPCQEGTIRLPAYREERQGDTIRVVTGEPELLKNE